MGKFVLDTSAVLNAAAKIKNYSGELNGLAHAVSNFSVDIPEIDFSKALNAIKNNINSAKEKADNISNAFNKVVEAHEALQNELRFQAKIVKQSTQSTTQSNNTYTVKKGDTLSEIAKASGTTVAAIAEANNIKNPNLIYPNQEFIIPGEESKENAKVEEKGTVSPTALNREETKEINIDNKTSLTNYRVTSYYPGDGCNSGTVTGSGKRTSDFKTKTVEGKQVYTYNDKIVVAAATEELLREAQKGNIKLSRNGASRQDGKHYFSYYDEITININGNNYEAIVLDSCGAAMWEGEQRIDIFVPSASNVVDTTGVNVYY